MTETVFKAISIFNGKTENSGKSANNTLKLKGSIGSHLTNKQWELRELCERSSRFYQVRWVQRKARTSMVFTVVPIVHSQKANNHLETLSLCCNSSLAVKMKPLFGKKIGEKFGLRVVDSTKSTENGQPRQFFENSDKWLNTNEAAEYLRTSVPTLLNMCCNGSIVYYKLGRSNRFKKSDLDNLLKLKRGGLNGF